MTVIKARYAPEARDGVSQTPSLHSPACVSRDRCAPVDTLRAPKQDIVAAVASVGAMPGCAYEDWTYVINVAWRVKRADGGGILAETTTRCQHFTNRGVDDWFAHSEAGRAEFEQALRAIGKRMADELAADQKMGRCFARRLKGGQIVLD